MPPSELELRTHLERALNRSWPLESFRHWFANALWSLESAVDDDTLEFAYLIENRIAERSGGWITDDELLTALATDFVRHYGEAAPTPAYQPTDASIVAFRPLTPDNDPIVRGPSFRRRRITNVHPYAPRAGTVGVTTSAIPHQGFHPAWPLAAPPQGRLAREIAH